MKREYSSPDFEFVKLTITKDVLTISDPESSIPEGGGGASAVDDPFAGLGG
nr:hypothetical protein [uncultured Ruminococcus sp.]